jgi:putative NADPH-quinone reductase
MRILLVLAHPLSDSFAASLAGTIERRLTENGHTVDLLDLYREGFDPRLTESERARYFEPDYDPAEAGPFVSRLKQADGIVLVFPQWWFNFPAILKGFFDRVFVPGVAFENDPAGGRIQPRLGNIRLFWAFTTTGSPWWVVNLYMGKEAAEARHRRFLRQRPRFPYGQSLRHGPRGRGQAQGACRAHRKARRPDLITRISKERS